MRRVVLEVVSRARCIAFPFASSGCFNLDIFIYPARQHLFTIFRPPSQKSARTTLGTGAISSGFWVFTYFGETN